MPTKKQAKKPATKPAKKPAAKAARKPAPRPTDDRPLLSHIDELVKEEERLYSKGQLSLDDQSRLNELKVQLDQSWDLLRQRRALREFGEDPDKAKVRSAKVVENYEQ